MKYLLEKGYLKGDCMTVTSKTVAQNLVEVKGLAEGQKVSFEIKADKMRGKSSAENLSLA